MAMETRRMRNDKFQRIAKAAVVEYVNEHVDKTDGVKITEADVFIVWSCKTLQNNKALLSTTLHDGMYYELTYNGDKDELYFVAYKKFQNVCLGGSMLDRLEDANDRACTCCESGEPPCERGIYEGPQDADAAGA